MNNKKIVLIGTGLVGSTMVYKMINSNTVDEIVLIDENKEKAEGEKIDLSNALVFTEKNIKIRVGNYDDCKDAKIVVITAGTNRRDFNTRLDMVAVNTSIVKEITKNVVNSGFNGIFLVATNPVDIMAYVVQKVSGFDRKKVIGTGTILDTARLKNILSEKFEISSKNIHAYVLGEHGDSSFAIWNHVTLGCEKIETLIEQKKITTKELDDIYKEVVNMGYDISNKKGATYYGIAMSLNRIVQAILEDENTVITVSAHLSGKYNNYDVYIGIPCIINNEGIKEILELHLTDNDKVKMDNSCKILKKIIDENNL